jgi:hypothetical protein
VWQFKFACCPQVQEISSVFHQLFCFGVGFLLCLFTGDLFLCLAPFLWGKSVICQPVPSCQCVVIVHYSFFFCRAFWLLVLLTHSGDKLHGLLPVPLLQWFTSHVLLAFLPFQPFVFW